jgi:hypothetical protein
MLAETARLASLSLKPVKIPFAVIFYLPHIPMPTMSTAKNKNSTMVVTLLPT